MHSLSPVTRWPPRSPTFGYGFLHGIPDALFFDLRSCVQRTTCRIVLYLPALVPMSHVTEAYGVGNMTTIKTTCDHCGEIHLGPADIALELGTSETDATYRFVCPECLSVQRRPATSRVVSILLATGVSYAVNVEARSPITPGEIDDFVALLDGDDWFILLASSEGK